MDSFYTIAASNASLDLYPDNDLIQFKNNLPQEIDVTDYLIALQSISFDNTYGNVPNNVIGTKNHFILFSKQFEGNNVQPVIVINLNEDITMSLSTVVKKLNVRNTPLMTVKGVNKILEIVLRKSILLVHKNVADWLYLSGETIVYKNSKYIKLDAQTLNNKSFLAQKEFQYQASFPKMVKVQLEEMQSNIGEVKLVQDLATIVVKNKYPFYNVCKRKEYFKLNTNRLTSVKISLVDENNFPLQVSTGHATFVKLQLKKFPMKSFPLRLSSLESSNIFTDNISSSFRIQLQQPLDERREWDVALSSVFLPSKIDKSKLLTEDNFFVDISVDKGETYKRVLLNEMKDFSQAGFITYFHKKQRELFADKKPIELSDDKKDLHIKLEDENVAYRISGFLGYLLARAPFDYEEYYTFKYETAEKKYSGRLNFSKMSPHTLLIYCNFINPIVVGNVFAQVLQMIPYADSESVNGDVMKYEAQHLDFLPVSMNDKTILQFEMRDSAGNLIHFANENSEILLTLVFREKM